MFNLGGPPPLVLCVSPTNTFLTQPTSVCCPLSSPSGETSSTLLVHPFRSPSRSPNFDGDKESRREFVLFAFSNVPRGTLVGASCRTGENAVCQEAKHAGVSGILSCLPGRRRTFLRVRGQSIPERKQYRHRRLRREICISIERSPFQIWLVPPLFLRLPFHFRNLPSTLNDQRGLLSLWSVFRSATEPVLIMVLES